MEKSMRRPGGPSIQIAVLFLIVAGFIGTALADGPIRLSANPTATPVVAYNSTDHEYLVVWSELVNTGTAMVNWVLGQRVTESGAMIGSAFVVFPAGVTPVVAYNSSANEYLVAFNPGSGYAGQRVSSTGLLIGSPTGLMTGASDLQLVYNSIANQYLVVGGSLVEDSPGSGTYHSKLESRKIGADGQPLGAPALIDEPTSYLNFAVAYAPIQSTETPTGRYLFAPGAGGLLMLDSDGKPIDIVRDPSHPGVRYREIPFQTGTNVGGHFHVDVAYGTNGTNGPAFLVVWSDANNSYGGYGWSGIYGNFVDAQKIEYLTTDEVKDYSFPINFIWDHWARDPEVMTWRPRVSFNPSSQKFYVVWRETPGTDPKNGVFVPHIRGSAAFKGIPSGISANAVISATTGAEDPTYPALAASTTTENALVVWQDYRDKAVAAAIYGSVQKVADPVPPPPPTTRWEVTNTNDDGPGSLRQAIISANGRAGRDTIAFNIPGGMLYTISPLSELPAVTDTVIIDGYTQPGSSPNTNSFPNPLNAVLKVELSGAKSGPVAAGLRLKAAGCIVRGLIVTAFMGSGIEISGPGGGRIEGNYIGTDAAGKARNENWVGVRIVNSPGNIIGGTTAASRNLIAGNHTSGISIERPGATDNLVQGNYIGVDAGGTGPLGNISQGVNIEQGSRNIVGGTDAGAGNLIGGAGKFFGGIPGTGVYIRGDTARANKVQGNLIGTDYTGTAKIESYQAGIQIEGKSDTVGGQTPQARNLVSGCIWGFELYGDSTVVQGNYIGTDITGTKAIPNGSGVECPMGRWNLIGGRTAGARNLISGNGSGIFFTGYSCDDRVEGNWIGLQADGTSPLGNEQGMVVAWWSTRITIGGAEENAGNVLAFSKASGIYLADQDTDPTEIRICSNSIYGSGKVGIDLTGGVEDTLGCTANHTGGPAAGPNGLLNYPVLSHAEGGDYLYLQGKYSGQPNTSYRIEYFSTARERTPTGRDGEQFLGWTLVTTDAKGDASWSGTIGTPVPGGRLITATATDPAGNTSEFSAPAVTSTPLGIAGRDRGIPTETALFQNYPNPFNPVTVIEYALRSRCHVALSVYNALGQKVAELVNGDVEAGYHTVTFPAGNLASGVYFYRLQAGSFTALKKLCLLK